MTGLAELVRLAFFVVFVAFGLCVRRSRGRAASAVIALTLAVTLLTGFTQREAWPFTNWALFHHLAPERFGGLAIELVDADGRGFTPDPRMWEPVAEEEALAWLNLHFELLGPDAKHRFAADVLARANAARDALARRRRAPNQWLLGPLAAPYHFVRRGSWSAATPRFVTVRVTRIGWNPERRARDAAAVDREVVYDTGAR